MPILIYVSQLSTNVVAVTQAAVLTSKYLPVSHSKHFYLFALDYPV